MKKSIFKLLALACCLILFIAAATADLNGKWKAVIITPEGESLDAVYNFKVEGDQLSGTAESPNGVVTIDSGKVTGDNFSFQVTVDGNDYPHKGTIYGDSCGVDIDFGGQTVHTTLLRDSAR